ncbi:hypothetical protein IT575_12705 [bacterium]|nr:hypothetical protein [bacterium]
MRSAILLIVVLVHLCLLAACGKGADPALDEHAATNDPQFPSRLPGLEERATVPTGSIPAARHAALAPLLRSHSGSDFYLASSTVTADIPLQRALFSPAAAGFAWAIYEFNSALEADSAFSIELGFAPGQAPQSVSLAFADYSARAWQWQSAQPVANSAGFPAPQTSLLSPAGSLFVAVAIAAPDSGALQSVSLHSLSSLPPPLGLQASDGTWAAEIRLGWQDPALSYSADFPEGLSYDYVSVQRADSAAGPWAEIAQIPAGSFACCDDGAGAGLAPGAAYHYRLQLARGGLLSLPGASDPGAAADAPAPGAWQHSIGRPGYDTCFAACMDLSGALYLCGTIDDSSGIRTVVTSYAADGAQRWIRTYSSGEQDYGRDIELASDGTLFVLLQSRVSAPPREVDFTVLQLAQDGQLMEEFSWGSSLSDYPFDLEIDAAGDLLLAGESNAAGPGQQSAVVKLSPAGELRWQQHFGGPGAESARALAIDCEGRIFVAGFTENVPPGDEDVLLYELSADGSFSAGYRYGAALNEEAGALALSPDGTALWIAASSNSAGAGQNDAVLLAVNPASGVLDWQLFYGGSSPEYLYSISLAPDGTLWAAGSTASFGHGGDDLLLLSLSPAGALLSQEAWGASNDQSGRVACDFGGGLYLYGNTRKAAGDWQVISGSTTVSGLSQSDFSASSGPIPGSVREPGGSWAALSFATADSGAGDSDLLAMRRQGAGAE